MKTALGKMTVDQLTFAPICLCGFVSVMDALQGFKIDQIKQDLRNNYVDILISNFKVHWIAFFIFYSSKNILAVFINCVAYSRLQIYIVQKYVNAKSHN